MHGGAYYYRNPLNVLAVFCYVYLLRKLKFLLLLKNIHILCKLLEQDIMCARLQDGTKNAGYTKWLDHESDTCNQSAGQDHEHEQLTSRWGTKPGISGAQHHCWNADPSNPLLQVGTTRPAIVEKAVCTTSSGRAMKHADVCHCRCGNSGGPLVHNMFLMYFLDDANVCGSRGDYSEGALPIHLFRHFCCRMYHFTTMHDITDRQKDSQTDNDQLQKQLNYKIK